MTHNVFPTVAVLGAGTMGAGIAQVCAQAGSRVVLQDITEEFVQKGLGRIRDFLQKGVDKGKVTEAQRGEVLGRITATTDRAAASRPADLVIEAVPEKLELKNGLFRELAGVVAPACVLASNTSSLSLAKVFAGVRGADRCIGMHFFNPVPLMALLELVRTDATSPATVDAVTTYARQLGKEPIVVKDSPGFAASRRSAWSKRASRRRRTSTRRWCSVTATRWDRCGSPTWSVSTSASRSRTTWPRNSTIPASRRRS